MSPTNGSLGTEILVMTDEENRNEPMAAAEAEARAALVEQSEDSAKRAVLLAETKEKYPEEFAAVMDEEVASGNEGAAANED